MRERELLEADIGTDPPDWILKAPFEKATINEWYEYGKQETREGLNGISEMKKWLRGYSLEGDVDFALGLGMTIVLGVPLEKKPLSGRKWGKKNYQPPDREEILNHIRKTHGMIACETGRSGLVMIDIDRDRAQKKDNQIWPFMEKTLSVDSPGKGGHLYFINDCYTIKFRRNARKRFTISEESGWLKNFLSDKPGFMLSLEADYDVLRLNNGLGWLPPSRSYKGRYYWHEPRIPLMLFSDFLEDIWSGMVRKA